MISSGGRTIGTKLDLWPGGSMATCELSQMYEEVMNTGIFI
jgi:hypothetical protein